MLYGTGGVPARIAVVVDQLDDAHLRTPLVEDVLTAFPHAELFVIDDRRDDPDAPIAGHRPTCLAPRPSSRPGLFGFGRSAASTPPIRLPAGHDLVLRIGDRRARSFRVSHDTLDLFYILALGDDTDERAGLGAGYRDRCALQSADIVWAGSRRLMAALRRRWQVDAQLLYPPAEPPTPTARGTVGRRVVALIEGASPSWVHRLENLARLRPDLVVAAYGTPALTERPRRSALKRHPKEATAAYLADVEQAIAVVVPPGDAFDPQVVWAQAAGVPVVAPPPSAAAELIQGLEHREPTGFVLEEAGDEALADAIAFIEANRPLWPPDRLMAHALRWSRPRFRRTLKSLVFDAWCAHLAVVSKADEDLGLIPASREAAIPD
ncbi:MAG: hypothetical protein EA356_01450 [Geminicoccaceae bacterium]|nr:MAG: hypothetical protein EA356_01450 [Geminicoccaceae bacterium]